MMSFDTKVRQVKALSHQDVKMKRIRNTAVNRAIIDIMSAIADENNDVAISEAELSMLAGVYIDLKTAAPFKDLRELNDPGVRAFLAGVKNVTKVEEKKRGEAWVAAYNTWEKGAHENKWWHSPWGHCLLSFVQRERLMAYGYRLMPKPPRYAQ